MDLEVLDPHGPCIEGRLMHAFVLNQRRSWYVKYIIIVTIVILTYKNHKLPTVILLRILPNFGD